MWPKWLTKPSGSEADTLREQNELLKAILLRSDAHEPPRRVPARKRTAEDVVVASRAQRLIWQRKEQERGRLRSLDERATPFPSSPSQPPKSEQP